MPEKILKGKQSPDSVCGRAKLFNLFEEMICIKTLYNYIERGLLKIKNIDLAVKVRRKPKRYGKHKNIKKLGESIENRPQEMNYRISFEHWEIDTVVGKRAKDEVLLTLDERLTRFRHILKIESKTTKSIIKEIRKLKESYGDSFNEIFKTVTSDNCSEFADLIKNWSKSIMLIRIHHTKEEQVKDKMA